MNDSIVPCEQASKQPKGGISSPPANTWIFSLPPLISSVIFAIFCAAPCRTSSAGVHVVDMRHWNRCCAITFGASASATAAAPVAIAVFFRKFLRSIKSSVRERVGSARRAREHSIGPNESATSGTPAACYPDAPDDRLPARLPALLRRHPGGRG